MITEALQYLAALKEQALKPIKLDMPDPRTARFAAGSEVLEFEIPAQPRNHKPANLDEVIALAARFGGVVWYNHEAVTLVIDDDLERIEKATLKLEYSDVFALLMTLRDKKSWHDHKAFVRMLRVELAGALSADDLLNKVKSVKFDSGVVVSSKLSRGDESLGRTITSKVDASGEIPEEVTLQAPVFKTPGETDRLPVRCAVDMLPIEGKFQLLPIPDEIERVITMAVESIGEDLLSSLPKTVPCYFGAP